MAIWQFHIYFIPKKSLLNKYGQVPTQLAMDKESWNGYFQNSDLDKEPEFEDALTIHWWLDLNINLDNLLPLLKSFGDIQSWTQNSDGLRSFGDTDTNDISMPWFVSGALVHVSRTSHAKTLPTNPSGKKNSSHLFHNTAQKNIYNHMDV